MKVLLVNGSARVHGNTATALQQIAQTLEAEGIDTQIFQLGAGTYRDCIACNRCSDLDGHCVFDDDPVNEFLNLAAQADGFVFGTPVYYAHPSGRTLSFLDRAFYAGGAAFAHKPGASIAVARRAGTCSSVDVLNKYFTINQMPVVSSTYWNVAFEAHPKKPFRTPRAWQPCATWAATWHGYSNASKRGAPRASPRPSRSAPGRTSFVSILSRSPCDTMSQGRRTPTKRQAS